LFKLNNTLVQNKNSLAQAGDGDAAEKAGFQS
jgi:hypothetical protein